MRVTPTHRVTKRHEYIHDMAMKPMGYYVEEGQLVEVLADPAKFGHWLPACAEINSIYYDKIWVERDKIELLGVV